MDMRQQTKRHRAEGMMIFKFRDTTCLVSAFKNPKGNLVIRKSSKLNVGGDASIASLPRNLIL